MFEIEAMAKFQPGQSGNPSGRRKEIAEVRELARAQTGASIDALVSIRDSAKAPAAARVTAATALLDRAWGKPTTTLASDPLNPILNVSVQPDLRAQLDVLTKDQRDQLRGILKSVGGGELAMPSSGS